MTYTPRPKKYPCHVQGCKGKSSTALHLQKNGNRFDIDQPVTPSCVYLCDEHFYLWARYVVQAMEPLNLEERVKKAGSKKYTPQEWRDIFHAFCDSQEETPTSCLSNAIQDQDAKELVAV